MSLGLNRMPFSPTSIDPLSAYEGPTDPNHKREWVEAIKAGKPEVALSNFEYASMLTAAFLLGNAAIRSGKAFDFDTDKLHASDPAAQKYIKGEYRKGWDLLDGGPRSGAKAG